MFFIAANTSASDALTLGLDRTAALQPHVQARRCGNVPAILFLAFTGGESNTIGYRVGTFRSFKHPKKWTQD